ncbi:hypothetical protein ACM41_11685 [Bradyrhizobium sp. CCBAU 21362]|nr:hypothetical protein [Bradyrhizobium sp. CCBAU 21362]
MAVRGPQERLDNVFAGFLIDAAGSFRQMVSSASNRRSNSLFQLNLRLNGPDDPFEGSFSQPIISEPFHCPIRSTLQFPERGDFVSASGARQ